ncbi:MAG: hypothetical protein OEM52_13390 [bacterium]|nr:hypothetical protein [bacterium]
MITRLLSEFDGNRDLSAVALFDTDGFVVEQIGSMSSETVATLAALCREYGFTAGQANSTNLRIGIQSKTGTLFVRSVGTLRIAITLANPTKFGVAEVLADRVQQRCEAFVPHRRNLE